MRNLKGTPIDMHMQVQIQILGTYVENLTVDAAWPHSAVQLYKQGRAKYEVPSS